MGNDVLVVVPLEEYERNYVLAVLDRFEGNRTLAAQALKISVRGLQYMLLRWRKQGFLAAVALAACAIGV